MRKILILLISLTIILSLIFFTIKDKLNINKILKNIETDTGINITLQENKQWSYYPKISYQNNLSLYGNDGKLIIENSNISITKNYGLTSPFVIKYQSPSILYKGINFRDSKINSEYSNKIINLNKFSAKVIDGNINIKGYLSVNSNEKISLSGSYDNISINRILKQLKIANWERVKIKLSSSQFSLNTINNTSKKIIENLNGEMNISGSIFFVSKEEEHFGATFLSLLANKFLNIKPLSKSLNYLLDKFADIPSDILGKINITEGILTTKKLLIENQKEKAFLTASLDLKSNEIDGKIDFYRENDIFLTAELKGNIKNPEILIGGEVFAKGGYAKPQNIKEVFDKGIQSLVDSILNPKD